MIAPAGPTTQRAHWIQTAESPKRGAHALQIALEAVDRPLYLMEDRNKGWAVAHTGTLTIVDPGQAPPPDARPALYAPPLLPQTLGDQAFKSDFNLTYAYICGAMANGITSESMVTEAGRAGMLGFFGAAGLSPRRVASAIDQLAASLGDIPHGFNLIHSPNDMVLEQAIVDLYLARHVRLISASAYLDMTEPLVHYRVKGILREESGRVVSANRLVAKVSREEVARKFLAPPPKKHLDHLVAKGKITSAEASLAAELPMADALTAEADSGGHTDNRPALTLLPTMLSLRDEMIARHGFAHSIPVGLGGGIATPEAAAAAFAMGAAYVLTGSINQACVEAGTSPMVRQMLAEARQADVTMAPAADMFELGVKVQVLKRGTMFSMRAHKLFDLYRSYDCWESIPAKERDLIEKTFLRRSFENEWVNTRAFFLERDPVQVEKAEASPKHKLALVFRSYLGQASRWATAGDQSRSIDYQIWCGPAMGAFNQWVRGSFLEAPENRRTITLAHNILYGAAVMTRANWLRSQGAALPPRAGRITPLSLDEIAQRTSSTS